MSTTIAGDGTIGAMPDGTDLVGEWDGTIGMDQDGASDGADGMETLGDGMDGTEVDGMEMDGDGTTITTIIIMPTAMEEGAIPITIMGLGII